MRRIIASFSTEQGPAMMVKVPGPMVVCGSLTKVSASCISRLASLYGLVTRISSITPGSTSSVRGSTAPMLPVMPMAVRIAPGMGCGVRSIRRIARDHILDLVWRGVGLHDDQHERFLSWSRTEFIPFLVLRVERNKFRSTTT